MATRTERRSSPSWSSGSSTRAWTRRAAEQATRRSAHTEAIDHLQRALALLGTLPEGAELLAHAERTGVISQLLFAHSTLGVALHYSGEVEKALEHQEQAIALCDSIERQSLEFVYGLDPGVTSECLSSFGLLQLGYPDRALDRAERAIEHARAHHYAYGLAYALNWGAIVHHERGEPGRVLERATEAFEISTERGLSQQLGGAAIYRACALSHLSDEEAAGKTVDAVAKSIRGSRPTAPVSGPFLAAFADAQRRLQRMDDALGTVDSWLSYSNEIGAPYWDAEHLRLKGEILLANDPASHDEPERLFRHAISIANSQHGRSLEIRAANSLARLLSSVGKREEARDLLQPLYQAFTEGFGARDLASVHAAGVAAWRIRIRTWQLRLTSPQHQRPRNSSVWDFQFGVD